MIRRPPRSTRTDTLLPYTRSSDLLHLPRQVGPGGVEGEAELPGEGAENLHVIGAGRVGLGPGDDGALLEAEGFVGDDEFGVELLPFAQAVAGGAGALGGVEGEEIGRASCRERVCQYV